MARVHWHREGHQGVAYGIMGWATKQSGNLGGTPYFTRVWPSRTREHRFLRGLSSRRQRTARVHWHREGQETLHITNVRPPRGGIWDNGLGPQILHTGENPEPKAMGECAMAYSAGVKAYQLHLTAEFPQLQSNSQQHDQCTREVGG